MRNGVCDPREWRGGRDQSDEGEERLVDFAAARTVCPLSKERGAARGTRWWRDRAVPTTAVGIILECARATCPQDGDVQRRVHPAWQAPSNKHAPRKGKALLASTLKMGFGSSSCTGRSGYAPLLDDAWRHAASLGGDSDGCPDACAASGHGAPFARRESSLSSSHRVGAADV